MFKPTPNPQESDCESTASNPPVNSRFSSDAPDETLEDYLKSSAGKNADTPYKPNTMFMIAPD